MEDKNFYLPIQDDEEVIGKLKEEEPESEEEEINKINKVALTLPNGFSCELQSSSDCDMAYLLTCMKHVYFYFMEKDQNKKTKGRSYTG